MHSIRIFLTLLMVINTASLFAQNDMGIQERRDQTEDMQTENYGQVLASALFMQLKADSLARIARDKRILSKEIPDEVLKKELTEEIIFYEQEAKTCQLKADQLFARAKQIKENRALFSDVGDSVLLLYKTVNDIQVYQYKAEATIRSATNHVSQNGITSDNIPPVIPEIVSENQGPDHKDDFIILSETPYSIDNPFPEGIKVIPGLSYRIQLGVFSNPVPYDAFVGISPIYIERVQGKNILKYYAGLFYSLADVSNALDRIRNIGFPDAFIVAFLDGNQISTEKAREIEYAQYKL